MARRIDDAPKPLGVVHRLGECVEPPHASRHDFHVIGMVLRGEGEYRVAGLEPPGAPPWVMFVPRGDEDADGLSGLVESWYVMFEWPGLRVRPTGPREIEVSWGGRSARVPRYVRPSPESIAELSRAFESVRSALARQDLGGDLTARSALMGLMAMYCELPRSDDGVSHRALERFRRALEERACDDVSVEELAARTRLTADHLRGLFRAKHGTSPVAYRTSVRMARARDLLVASSLNVGEVAARVGYADPLYFSRAFRRHFGVPPSEFIRRRRLPAQYVRDADIPPRAR